MSWDTGPTGNWKEESGAFDDGFKESGGDKCDGGDAGAGVTDFGGGATNGEANENGGGGAFTCRSCGEGHKARDCPTNPSAGNDGKCFNCGEDGHNKSDCPNPRVFTGSCRICNQVGHPAAECPEKPPQKCFNCKQEGHATSECKSNRVFDDPTIPDMTVEEAWAKLLKADEDRDLDDFRFSTFKIYSKACPDATYEDLERAFRLNHFKTFLIATEKELPKTHTYVNLQGELDKTYQVGYYFSPKPKRAIMAASWPESTEENLERLKDAGMPLDRGIPKCNRCDELGHTAKSCPEEATEVTDRVQVRCVNCDEIGHRARDCQTPRVDKFACRNCKQSGHAAAECTEPRSAEGVECRKCNEIGHFSKDCPNASVMTCRNCGVEGHISKECDQPRNPANTTCRNCDEVGHFSKECPKPKDWSKVTCRNCGENGHGAGRCPKPKDEVMNEEGDGGDTGGFDNTGGGTSFNDTPMGGGGDDWGQEKPITGGNSWESSAPTTVAW